MDDQEVVKQLAELIPDIKALREKHDELKAVGADLTEVKATLEKLVTKSTELQTQFDAMNLENTKHHVAGTTPAATKSFGQMVLEDPEFVERMKRGSSAVGKKEIHVQFDMDLFEGRKSTITTGGVGTGTSGVQMPQRLFIDPLVLAMQGLRVRDLLTVRRLTTGNSFDYPVQNLRTNAPSPQTEGETKAESTYGWTSQIGAIRTIAHWTNVSVQALDDIPWMRSTLDSELLYGLLLKEEAEILAGSGVGLHLNGLITQATAYAGTYNVSGDTKIDRIRWAILEARLVGLATFQADGIVLNPVDMAQIEHIKVDESAANTGLYILGSPAGGAPIKTLWGLPVVESDSITAGTFLVGAFRTGATLVDRMFATVDISFENDQNFVKNLATIRAEERIGLAVTRPTSFVKGTF